MNINTTYTKIITGKDLMETAQHGSTLYPFQFYYEDLSVFDFNCLNAGCLMKFSLPSASMVCI